MNEARTIIDARMAGKVRVTAGEHEVGYTWRDRPFERQDVWQPARRDSQEVHLITGLPRLKAVMVEGPYKVTGISSTPSREKIFICKPAGGGRRNGLRDQDSDEPRAPRVPAVRSRRPTSTRR